MASLQATRDTLTRDKVSLQTQLAAATADHAKQLARQTAEYKAACALLRVVVVCINLRFNRQMCAQ
jgi:hypothetical protein